MVYSGFPGGCKFLWDLPFNIRVHSAKFVCTTWSQKMEPTHLDSTTRGAPFIGCSDSRSHPTRPRTAIPTLVLGEFLKSDLWGSNTLKALLGGSKMLLFGGRVMNSFSWHLDGSGRCHA